MAYAAWTASTAYSVGDVVHAVTLQPTGLVFRCTAAGTSAATQPPWPTDIGSVITDGTVTWQAISSTYEELATFAPDAIIELFQLELIAAIHGSSDTYYFHAGVNANVTGNIIWNGQTYFRFPIQAEGFEYSNGGTLPRPTLSIANLGGEISALLLLDNALTPGNDLGGAKVTRIRTLKRYLDGEPTADPHAKFADEVWYIDRKAAETRDIVQWELASKFDLAGMMIPKRQIIANVCQWQYRSPECGYNGPPVADADDNYLTFSAIPELQSYLTAATAYRNAKADRQAKADLLATAANALDDVKNTYTLAETRYVRTANIIGPPLAQYYIIVSGGSTTAIWNNVTVTLGSVYRQGAFVTSVRRSQTATRSFYEIQRWEQANTTSQQAAYNTALSNYNTAVATEASALAAAQTARDAYLAIMPPGGPSEDVCGKRLSSCRLRFKDLITNEIGELPFGSFPGAGLVG